MSRRPAHPTAPPPAPPAAVAAPIDPAAAEQAAAAEAERARVAEYTRLVEGGLSDAEARATVWPELPPGRPIVPTLDEVLAAGYAPDVAPKIIARQQALAVAFDEAAAAPPAVPDGHVVLLAPLGAASCSVAGGEYPVVDGRVTVPPEAVAPLAPLGFRLPDVG